MTKICWDNFISVSPKTAQKLKLSEGDVVELEVEGRRQKAPVHVQPGTHDGTMALALGYGRWASGKVASGSSIPKCSILLSIFIYSMLDINGET